MSDLFSTIRLVIMCGTGLLIATGLMSHLPNSPLRNVLLKVCGWATAALCGAYVLSPVDLMPEALLGPFGLPDDVIALVVGAMSAMSAWKAGHETAADH